MPDDIHDEDPPHDARYRHSRVILYLTAMLIAVPTGIATVADETALMGWRMWVLGAAFTLWAWADAHYHRRPLPTLSLWVVFMFWPFAVPACTIRVYGGLAGSIYVALHVVLLVILIYGPWAFAAMVAAQ